MRACVGGVRGDGRGEANKLDERRGTRNEGGEGGGGGGAPLRSVHMEKDAHTKTH